MNDLYLMSMGMSHAKTADDIPRFVIFALALFCYYEMSDSSIAFYRLNDSTMNREWNSAHQIHLDRILQQYFVFFIIFSALALVITWFILDFNSVLKALGSRQIADSIELNSIYGTIVTLVVMIVILIIVGYFVRYEYRLKTTFFGIGTRFKRMLPEREREAKLKNRTHNNPKSVPAALMRGL